MPFCRTHIQLYKKMVDSINAEKFTVDQMAKKFKTSLQLREWEKGGHWSESSDLRLLLNNYMPDSSGDGILSYTSVMSLGLLLCQGTTYDKARILYQLVESNNTS